MSLDEPARTPGGIGDLQSLNAEMAEFRVARDLDARPV